MKPRNVDAAILTHSNPSGLNALLWTLYNQTRRPDSITIYSTGNIISDPQLLSTINLVAKKIPVELFYGKNICKDNLVHLGLIREAMFRYLKSRKRDWVWLFDDDLIPAPNCLELQLMVKGASVPYTEEDGRSVLPIEERYYKDFYSKKNTPAQRGSAHGLLAPVSKLVKVNLAKLFIFEDTELLEKLKPMRVVNAIMNHTKVTSNRAGMTYAYIEKLYHGDL